MVDSIKQAEPKAERSLMHRFNLAKVSLSIHSGQRSAALLIHVVYLHTPFCNQRALQFKRIVTPASA